MEPQFNDHIEEAKNLLDELLALKDHVTQKGHAIYKHFAKEIQREAFVKSGKNLAHYLALRQKDIRGLQERLIPFGLSSLGRLESKTLITLTAVIRSLAAIAGLETTIQAPELSAFYQGQESLKANTLNMFGALNTQRRTHIMVTMPTEASYDQGLIDRLLEAGMNVARINCAHDSPEIWEQMIHLLRQRAQAHQFDLQILMDIAGPKIRTDWVFTQYKKPRVSAGDKIAMTRDYQRLPNFPEAKVTVGCQQAGVFESLSLGDEVSMDDGSVECHVTEVQKDYAILTVDKTSAKSIRIKAEKGINFPGVDLDIEVVTEDDRLAFDFALDHADIIGSSFVRNGEDIKLIQALIWDLARQKNLDPSKVKLMAKIETVSAVKNLAEIIYTAAGKNPFSIMIARGDLAVETGYPRLAEVQQEILWIAEACDIPVVWATEVLAKLIDTGIPSRAEVTDAGTGVAAECVMLNKGDYIVEAVQMLDEILVNMEAHQSKKTPSLRALSIAKIDM